MDEVNKPLSEFPPVYDAKWRFFWAIGERSEEDTLPKVLPERFPEWEAKMNKWGNMMYEACFTACKMAAVGMGLDEDALSKRM